MQTIVLSILTYATWAWLGLIVFVFAAIFCALIYATIAEPFSKKSDYEKTTAAMMKRIDADIRMKRWQEFTQKLHTREGRKEIASSTWTIICIIAIAAFTLYWGAFGLDGFQGRFD